MVCDTKLIISNILNIFNDVSIYSNKLNFCKDMRLTIQIYQQDEDRGSRVYPYYISNDIYITEDEQSCFGPVQIESLLLNFKEYLKSNNHKHYYILDFRFFIETNNKVESPILYTSPTIQEKDIYEIILKLFHNSYVVENSIVSNYYD